MGRFNSEVLLEATDLCWLFIDCVFTIGKYYEYYWFKYILVENIKW